MIVSAFLKTVEYHDGVLFMTTNRFKCFDKAFQSRVNITLHYPDLTAATRVLVWENLLKSVGASDKVLAQCAKLAEFDLNGRYIRNVVRVAFEMGLVHKTGITFQLLREAIAFACVPPIASKMPPTNHPVLWKIKSPPKPVTTKRPRRRRRYDRFPMGTRSKFGRRLS